MGAREIADSDDDDDEQLGDGALEFETPGTAEKTKLNANDPQASAASEGFNFSQFLSQSQSYNGLASSQPASQGGRQQPTHVQTQDLSPTQPFSTAVALEENNKDQNSTGSTERMRRDVKQIQGRFFDNGTSPTFSTNTTSSATEHSSGKLKRARDDDINFSSQRSVDEGGGRKKRRTYGEIGRSKSSTSLPNSFHLDEEAPNLEKASHADGFIDPSKLQDDTWKDWESGKGETAVTTIKHTRVQTIKSSVGGHQTLTITDPNHNPFADEGTNTSDRDHQTASIAEIFRPFQRTLGTNAFTNLNLPSSSDAIIDGNAIEKPEESRTNPIDDDPLQGAKRKRRQSDASVLSEQSNEDGDLMEMEVVEIPTQPKKRGRKPKAKAALAGDRQDLSEAQDGKKSSVKQFDNSPIKHPSSELHLSDEAFIGLPKENYVPRSTRRGRRGRSKPEIEASADDAEDLHVLSQASKTSQNPERPLETGTPAEDETIPLQSTKQVKRKPPKRAKGRKGKTMARTEADPTLTADDGEFNHVGCESLAKGEGPSENLAPKEENDGTDIDNREIKDADEESINNTGNKDHRDLADFTLEVKISRNDQESTVEDADDEPQVLAAIKKETPVPKKRGRKSKKSSTPRDTVAERDLVAEDEADEVKATTDHENEETSPVLPKRRGRPPLKEKSINVSTPTAIPPDGEAPNALNVLEPANENAQSAITVTVSPIKPVTSMDPDLQQDNKSPTVSTPPKTAPGLTQHSPINQSGGSVKYRVGLSKRARIPSLLSKVKRDNTPTPGK